MMKQPVTILWADDEIDLLKPQIQFLENKGFQIVPVTNGIDAIEKCESHPVDIVILDEMMPGLSGLETLMKIKEIKPEIPVVMITKNEEEDLMEEAIGSRITDYLLKPVNPKQVLLTIKKIVDNKRLVSEKTTANYQREFQKIFMSLQQSNDYQAWIDIYRKLVYWELELDQSETGEMQDILAMQKKEANVEFFKFIVRNYLDWVSPEGKEDMPVMSHTLMKNWVLPLLKEEKPVFLILIDNLRYDQWRVIQPIINENFRMEQEELYFSILPTATQYSRNAIFAGMMPLQIQKQFPDKWKNDDDEGGKNLFEADFLGWQIKTMVRKPVKFEFIKITNHQDGKNLEDNILNLMQNDLNIIVYNFVDMLSHARTDMEVLKELASDESAYRSITVSWFEHSPLHNALKKLAGKDIILLFTTDHGSIRVHHPSKCIGDRNTTTNIRYKVGKSLQYNEKDVFAVTDPPRAGLPKPNISSTFIFAKEDLFFVYPNNYNYYVNYFRNTFQHGGISLEEMVIPFARFSSR